MSKLSKSTRYAKLNALRYTCSKQAILSLRILFILSVLIFKVDAELRGELSSQTRNRVRTRQQEVLVGNSLQRTSSALLEQNDSTDLVYTGRLLKKRESVSIGLAQKRHTRGMSMGQSSSKSRGMSKSSKSSSSKSNSKSSNNVFMGSKGKGMGNSKQDPSKSSKSFKSFPYYMMGSKGGNNNQSPAKSPVHSPKGPYPGPRPTPVNRPTHRPPVNRPTQPPSPTISPIQQPAGGVPTLPPNPAMQPFTLPTIIMPTKTPTGMPFDRPTFPTLSPNDIVMPSIPTRPTPPFFPTLAPNVPSAPIAPIIREPPTNPPNSLTRPPRPSAPILPTQPTQQPITTRFCTVDANGLFGTQTGLAEELVFAYQTTVTPMVTVDELNLNIVPDIEVAIADLVLPSLFPECDVPNNLVLEGKRRNLQGSEIQGFSTRPRDVVVEGVECVNMEPFFPCFVVLGTVTTYTAGKIEDATADGLSQAIQVAIEDGELEQTNFQLLSVTYRDLDAFPLPEDSNDDGGGNDNGDSDNTDDENPGTTDDEFGNMGDDDSILGNSTDPNPTGIQLVDNGLQTWSVALIAVGGAITCCLAYLCLRKPSHSALDDDESDSDSSDDSDASSSNKEGSQQEPFLPGGPIFRPPITRTGTEDEPGTLDENDESSASDSDSGDSSSDEEESEESSSEDSSSEKDEEEKKEEEEEGEEGVIAEPTSFAQKRSLFETKLEKPISFELKPVPFETRPEIPEPTTIEEDPEKPRSFTESIYVDELQSVLQKKQQNNSEPTVKPSSSASEFKGGSFYGSLDPKHKQGDLGYTLSVDEAEREEPSQLSFNFSTPTFDTEITSRHPSVKGNVMEMHEEEDSDEESSVVEEEEEEEEISTSFEEEDDDDDEYEIEYVEEDEHLESLVGENDAFWDEPLEREDKNKDSLPILPWLDNDENDIT